MRDDWTFEDLGRLTSEAMVAEDKALLTRIWWSDNFEPSLGAEGGLKSIIIVTPDEKRAERKRVEALFAERAAIKARWSAQNP